MYIPRQLTKTDKLRQKHEIAKSKRLYKKGQYYTRKKLASFKTKPSKHLKRVKDIYKVDPLVVNKILVSRTGCPKHILNKIINKGMGAYYSSGSRPNQTARSWGVARLASAITGGPSSKVDLHLLEQCKHNKPAFQMAKK